MSDARPVDPDDAIRSVFRVLSHHVSEGQISKVREALPRNLRQMWDNAANSGVGEDMAENMLVAEGERR